MNAKSKAIALIALIGVAAATSAVAINVKPANTETKVDSQVEALASEIVAMAPRAASLDRPL